MSVIWVEPSSCTNMNFHRWPVIFLFPTKRRRCDWVDSKVLHYAISTIDWFSVNNTNPQVFSAIPVRWKIKFGPSLLIFPLFKRCVPRTGSLERRPRRQSGTSPKPVAPPLVKVWHAGTIWRRCTTFICPQRRRVNDSEPSNDQLASNEQSSHFKPPSSHSSSCRTRFLRPCEI